MKPVSAFFIIFLLRFEVFCQKSSFPHPFDSIKFDRVVSFNLNYDPINKKPLDTHREINLNSKDFKTSDINGVSGQKELKGKQIDYFIRTICDTSTYGATHAACFIPRLGFTFFNQGKDVMTILVCFECGFLDSSIPIPACYKKYYEVESTEDDKPIIVKMNLNGFSQQGIRKLTRLCEELKMGYCIN